MGDVSQVFLAELIVSSLPSGEHDLLKIDLSYRLPRERSRRRVRSQLQISCIPGTPTVSEVPAKVHLALEKVTAYRLQESAWQDARQGNVDRATRRLAAAATRLVKMGEDELAQAIEREALRMQQTGRVSDQGKKKIHYGTRRLGRQWFGNRRERRESP